MTTPLVETVWPLALFVALVVLLVAATLMISALLGERHTGQAMGEPYESGIVPTGTVAGLHFSIRFYLVAMFFVLFDLEAVFIYAWAVAFRPAGWTGLAEMSFFIAVLLATLVYLIRVGALEWGSIGRKSMERRMEEEAHADRKD
jgi:NADH-quinone oxidoreductase subunit A